MKSLLTVSSVVFAHICVFLLLVNGCHGPSNATSDWNSGTKPGTHIYSGGARGNLPAEAKPAEAVPAEAKPADAVPAEAEPVSEVPAQAQVTSKAPEASTTAEEKVHVVKSGEYLSMIAVRNGITSKELADANGIALTSVLQVGQKLKIPAPKAKAPEAKNAQVAGDIYVVQKGDVLGIIARKHKVSVKQIKDANNLKNDVIRVGQKLVIPSKDAKPAPAPKAEEAKKPAEAAPQAEPVEKQEEVVKEEEKEAPAEAVPAKQEEVAEEVPVEIDENFGMPEGGFGDFGDLDDAKTEDAPAESVPATGTPAK